MRYLLLSLNSLFKAENPSILCLPWTSNTPKSASPTSASPALHTQKLQTTTVAKLSLVLMNFDAGSEAETGPEFVSLIFVACPCLAACSDLEGLSRGLRARQTWWASHPPVGWCANACHHLGCFWHKQQNPSSLLYYFRRSKK